MNKIKNNLKNKNFGFALLFSILVATLVVSIGATIISIAVRQTILSGTARESQYAFYASNTALECAYYWDKIGNPDDNENNVIFYAPGDEGIKTTNLNNITCAGMDITNAGNMNPDSSTSEENIFKFNFEIQDRANLDLGGPTLYAEVTIKKKLINPDSNSGLYQNILTTIEAKGYNTTDVNNPRRVERGLIQQYES